MTAPDHLSNSQIQMALKCGQQYAYRYQEGLVLPPGFAMVRGKAVDAGVTQNLRQKIETGTDLPVEQVQQLAREKLEEEFRGDVVLDPDYEGQDREKAKGALVDEVAGLAKLHTERVSPTFQPAAVQLRVEIAPSQSLPIKFVGILDLIDSNRRIRDTKTAKKSASAGASDESDQLTAYDLLYRAHYKSRPTSLGLDQLVRTEAGNYSAKEFTSEPRPVDELRAYVARARAVLRMNETETYTPAPDSAWWCSARWCGYHGMCPYARGRKRPTS